MHKRIFKLKSQYCSVNGRHSSNLHYRVEPKVWTSSCFIKKWWKSEKLNILSNLNFDTYTPSINVWFHKSLHGNYFVQSFIFSGPLQNLILKWSSKLQIVSKNCFLLFEIPEYFTKHFFVTSQHWGKTNFSWFWYQKEMIGEYWSQNIVTLSVFSVNFYCCYISVYCCFIHSCSYA